MCFRQGWKKPEWKATIISLLEYRKPEILRHVLGASVISLILLWGSAKMPKIFLNIPNIGREVVHFLSKIPK